MYFHHLINGISNLPSVSNQIRIAVQSEFDEKGSEEMHKYLQKIDKKSSLRIHPNDSQRIKRAIEVYKATGKELSNWQTEQKKEINEIIHNSNILQIAIKPEDRQLHREYVSKRFLNMMEDGLIGGQLGGRRRGKRLGSHYGNLQDFPSDLERRHWPLHLSAKRVGFLSHALGPPDSVLGPQGPLFWRFSARRRGA